MSGSENVYPVPDYVLRMYDRLPGPSLITRNGGPSDGEILYASPDMLALFECRTLQGLRVLSGGTIYGLIYPDDVENARWFMQAGTKREQNAPAGSQESFRLQYRVRTKSGRVFSIVELCRPVSDPVEGELSYSLFLRSGEEMSGGDRDSLTALPNMRAFLSHAQKVQSENRILDNPTPVYYIYLNLARFKLFNMNHGIDAGDRYLIEVSNILRDAFPDGYLAHFGADHFAVLTREESYPDEIKRAHDEIAALREEGTIELKAGVYKAASDKTDIAVNAACDLAKIAADSIKNETGTVMRVYDDTLAQEIERKNYITENVDRAVKNGWIQVYYQPVVRSLTGHLCGFEALTRWIDPYYGFMSPALFIPTLEESRQIHKVDCFVIEEVCKRLHGEMAAGKDPVPVSFNLSRLDFLLCDCFQTLEDNVAKYEVPRDLIHVEVTESTIMQDRERMQMEIGRFRSAGYQVWMDDFGSGYSSLNMLKDFQFDEIKLDMEFLRTFTDRSREIIASTVRMAKKLGMHTLAEGVETKEQVEFLRSIGCERLQGFYFGKPAPYEESMNHCLEEKGLGLETRQWHHFYDEIGLTNLQTSQPLALITIEMKEEAKLGLLFYNQALEDLLHAFEYESVPEFIRGQNGVYTEQGHRVVGALEKLSKGEEHVHYVISPSGHYVRLDFTFLSEAEGTKAFSVIVTDLTGEEAKTERERMDSSLRSLLSSFDNVCFVHHREDYVEARFQGVFFSKKPGTKYYDIHRQVQDYADTILDPEDRERFLTFSEPDTMPDRIRASRSKNLMERFRVKTKKGEYRWKVFDCMLMPYREDDIVIVTVRDASPGCDKAREDRKD